VSVVVPFLGDRAHARSMLTALAPLAATPGDELVIADNTAEGIVAPLAADGITVVAAGDVRSASHARNAGAATATREWLLFVDADCDPPGGLIDAYFVEPVNERCGVLAGEIAGDPGQDAALARWARSRRGHWVEHHLDSGPHPGGVTANLMVRRSAFERVEGFRLGGGGDLDLCWRIQENGWTFAYRPEALIHHRDRETLRELWEQGVSYGGHQRHLRAVHGPTVLRPRLFAPFLRSFGGSLVWAVRGDGERARFKLIDGFWAGAEAWGWLSRGARARRAD
jgi:glycosyltransferase involved in cell wall biosynthesis